eukprot:TRINITY_DN18723_c0_g4_i2.p1 TRINITY_DN18723_c0_g4~~TRINITY_DN18723_c0_g4_i2.p1  ORF type:complete len:1947 (-),score=480.05 TRINITY_DN18723_c0_g4_i2:106-5649(-)
MPEMQRPTTGPEILVQRAVQGVTGDEDEAEDGEELDEIDELTRHDAAPWVDAASPLRSAQRRDYIFVAQASKGFTRCFAQAVPLEEWSFERRCDLCAMSCKRDLYVVRCYKRGQAKLHASLFYTGRDCGQALLRERQLAPQVVLRRGLRRLLADPSWGNALEELRSQCETESEVAALRQGLASLIQRRATPPGVPVPPGPPAAHRWTTAQRSQRKGEGVWVPPPLAEQALAEQLKKNGLRLALSSSLWTAVARALGHPSIKLFALRAEAAVRQIQDGNEASQESLLVALLSLLKCDAEILSSGPDESTLRSRRLRPPEVTAAAPGATSEAGPLATLQLCCMSSGSGEGVFSAVGKTLDAAQYALVRAYTPVLFSPATPEEQALLRRRRRPLPSASPVAIDAAAPVAPPAAALAAEATGAIVPVEDAETAQKLQYLIDTGVPKSAAHAKKALELAKGDADMAMYMLLDGEVPYDSDEVDASAQGEGERGADEVASLSDTDVEGSAASQPVGQDSSGMSSSGQLALADSPHREAGPSASAVASASAAASSSSRGGGAASSSGGAGASPAGARSGARAAPAEEAASATEMLARCQEALQRLGDTGAAMASPQRRPVSEPSSTAPPSGPAGSAGPRRSNAGPAALLAALQAVAHRRERGTGGGASAASSAAAAASGSRQPRATAGAAADRQHGGRVASGDASAAAKRRRLEASETDSSSSSSDESSEGDEVGAATRGAHVPAEDAPATLAALNAMIQALCDASELPQGSRRTTQVANAFAAMRSAKVTGALLKESNALEKISRCCKVHSNSDLKDEAQAVWHRWLLQDMRSDGTPKYFRCAGCSKVFLKSQEADHKAACDGFVTCQGCNQRVLEGELLAHEQTCTTAICPGCHVSARNRAALRQHTAGCIYATVCPGCQRLVNKRPTKLQEHLQVCKKVVQCAGCSSLVRESDLDRHLEQCETAWRCPGCRDVVRLDQKHAHAGSCQKMAPICACGTLLTKDEIEKHRMNCQAVRSATRSSCCKGCGAMFQSALALGEHLTSCPKMTKCRSCDTYVPSTDLDWHSIGPCPRTYEACRGCKAYLPKGQILWRHRQRCRKLKPCPGCEEQVCVDDLHAHQRSCWGMKECQHCKALVEDERYREHLQGCSKYAEHRREQQAQEKRRKEEKQQEANERWLRQQEEKKRQQRQEALSQASRQREEAQSQASRQREEAQSQAQMSKRQMKKLRKAEKEAASSQALSSSMALAIRPEAIAEKSVRIPAECTGMLIGTRGMNIKSLQDRFGVHVEVQAAKNGVCEVIVEADFSFDTPLVREAAKEIENMCSSKNMMIETSARGAVTGTGGSTIRRIRDENSVKIEMENDPSNASVTRVRIVGSRQGCDNAAAQITAIVEALDDVREVPIGSKNVLKSWANLRRLEQDHGVSKAQVLNGSTIRLVGPKEAVAAAAKTLQDMQFSVETSMPAKFRPKFFGDRGSNIKRLEQARDVGIFVKRDSETAEVSGRQADVEATVVEISAWVLALEAEARGAEVAAAQRRAAVEEQRREAEAAAAAAAARRRAAEEEAAAAEQRRLAHEARRREAQAAAAAAAAEQRAQQARRFAMPPPPPPPLPGERSGAPPPPPRAVGPVGPVGPVGHWSQTAPWANRGSSAVLGARGKSGAPPPLPPWHRGATVASQPARGGSGGAPYTVPPRDSSQRGLRPPARDVPLGDAMNGDSARADDRDARERRRTDSRSRRSRSRSRSRSPSLGRGRRTRHRSRSRSRSRRRGSSRDRRRSRSRSRGYGTSTSANGAVVLKPRPSTAARATTEAVVEAAQPTPETAEPQPALTDLDRLAVGDDAKATEEVLTDLDRLL